MFEMYMNLAKGFTTFTSFMVSLLYGFPGDE